MERKRLREGERDREREMGERGRDRQTEAWGRNRKGVGGREI